MKLNDISTLPDAMLYLAKYGLSASLKRLNNGKFKFINVPTIKNFRYPFKSVAKAMNCLYMHENGYVTWKRKQRKREKSCQMN